MIKLCPSLTGALVAIAMTVFGASAGAQQTQHARTATPTISAPQLAQQKSALAAEARQELGRANPRIEALRRADGSATGEARQRYDALLAQVKNRRDTLNRDLHAIDGATANRWPALKARVQRDIVQLRHSVQRVASVTAAKPRTQKPKH